MERKIALRVLLALSFLFSAAGCASVKLDEYANTSPKFTLRDFFTGPVYGVGMRQDNDRMVTQRFLVHMVGQWNGRTGTLRERIIYVDGTPARERKWSFVQLNDHSVEVTARGTAGDIVGTPKAESAGFATHLAYDADVPTGGTTQRVHFDQWMYMIRPDVVMSRTRMSRHGFHDGDLTVLYQKLAPTPENFRSVQ
jgi:hypothetical protein